MKWGVLIANRAKRQLRRLSADERDYIDATFEEMRDDPYDGDIKFLMGTGGALRRRIRDWRIVYEVDSKRRLIQILEVQRRSSNTY
jgi:mRNA-degrading endonuclease RelE of RelBE toxin-antitoxin system